MTTGSRGTRHLAALLLAVVLVALPACAAAPTSDGTPGPSTSITSGPSAGGETVPALHPSVDGYPAGHLVISRGSTELAQVAVRVADTPERRAHGLMEVPDLPAGVGMWFTYQEEHRTSFWMEDTLIPLDIAFVDAEGVIVQILSMTPCEVEDCPTYQPVEVYRDALEVPAGWFDEIGVRPGDTVERR